MSSVWWHFVPPVAERIDHTGTTHPGWSSWHNSWMVILVQVLDDFKPPMPLSFALLGAHILCICCPALCSPWSAIAPPESALKRMLPFLSYTCLFCSLFICEWGWPIQYIYTGYKYGGFALSYTVYTGYLYGSGQPYLGRITAHAAVPGRSLDSASMLPTG